MKTLEHYNKDTRTASMICLQFWRNPDHIFQSPYSIFLTAEFEQENADWVMC